MIAGREFAQVLEAAGYDFFTGVPCSLIEDVIATLETHPRLPYVAAVREDVGVGLAAGAWMAGMRPVVLLQNSGLGTGLNALVSLSLLYRLPALLVVTWRGHEGRDAPEHLLMGEITPRLLDLVGIPHRVLSPASLAADVAWAQEQSEQLSQPVALLVPPGVIETGAPVRASAVVRQRGDDPLSHHGPGAPGPGAPAPPRPVISRRDALEAAIEAVGEAPVVHANGYICRESFSLKDRPQNFYMIGSMGCASAIGLGVALARPRMTTVVFDGEGNLLMNLGILPMIGGGPVVGRGRPDNLVHVVFDNGVYGSTGNQASLSRRVRLDHVARACGYRSTTAVTTAAETRAAVEDAVGGGGPALILAVVTAEEQPAPRIPYPPEEIRNRFRGAIEAAAQNSRRRA